jgi:hypothetical protein
VLSSSAFLDSINTRFKISRTNKIYQSFTFVKIFI